MIDLNYDVKRVEYNWHYTTENGSEFQYYEVGKNGVKQIHYHGNHCAVNFDDGHDELVYNLNRVTR